MRKKAVVEEDPIQVIKRFLHDMSTALEANEIGVAEEPLRYRVIFRKHRIGVHAHAQVVYIDGHPLFMDRLDSNLFARLHNACIERNLIQQGDTQEIRERRKRDRDLPMYHFLAAKLRKGKKK
jgi:hypothetical protein